jgi:5'-nucleotidase
MKILIANDDGIYSPGIRALAKIALRFGEVRVFAPDVEQSSMGHAITHSRPMSVKTSPVTFEGIEAYRINGTPADCVALGSHIWENPDVVLSGINLGPNLGNAMWHSGTLAAAKQAVLLGFRGIALSTPMHGQEPDFGILEPYVEETLKILLQETTPKLYNVNFPSVPQEIVWTRQSVRHYDGKVVADTDPMGRQIFWSTVIPLGPAEEGTDRWAVENGKVSITPLRLDLTDEKELSNWTPQKQKQFH